MARIVRIVIGLVIVAGLLSAGFGDDVTLRGGPQELRGYRVVYRIEDRTEPKSVKHIRETVEVRRPYAGRLTSPATGRITSRTYLWQLDDKGVQWGVRRPPGLPTKDASYRALVDASRAGVASMHGSARVLGRTCAWFSYRNPSPDRLARATARDRVESCVDRAGIVLREIWTIDGTLARVMEATSVDDRAPETSRFLEGETSETVPMSEPETIKLVQTQTLVQDIGPDTPPVPATLVLKLPAGWRPDRAAAVATNSPGGPPTQYYAQTYRRGGAAVVVDISSSPRYAPPWRIDEGTRFVIGDGEGRVVFYTDRVEIRLLSPLGYARVTAPSRATAMRFVRGLHPPA